MASMWLRMNSSIRRTSGWAMIGAGPLESPPTSRPWSRSWA